MPLVFNTLSRLEVVQQLLLDSTGQPFPELMKRLVLGPAGMTLSTYEQPLPEANGPRLPVATMAKEPRNGGPKFPRNSISIVVAQFESKPVSFDSSQGLRKGYWISWKE